MPRALRLTQTLAAALLISSLATGLALSGCRPKHEASANRLVVASKNRIDTVDPGGAYTFGAMQLLSAIGDPLYAINASGQLEPRLAVALPRLSAIKGAFLATGLFILHVFIAQHLFANSGVWLNIVYPLLVLVVAYTALTLYHYVTEERERKKIKGAFRQYVPPVVIEEILKDPGRLKLGGQEKVITVLFSDLAGFSGYSERIL